MNTPLNHKLHKHIANNWLSFPENKPEQFSWVLVTVKSPVDKWVEIACFDGENFQLAGRGDTTFVTHWMPIPAPACC